MTPVTGLQFHHWRFDVGKSVLKALSKKAANSFSSKLNVAVGQSVAQLEIFVEFDCPTQQRHSWPKMDAIFQYQGRGAKIGSCNSNIIDGGLLNSIFVSPAPNAPNTTLASLNVRIWSANDKHSGFTTWKPRP
jgi:hypothetical protein